MAVDRSGEFPVRAVIFDYGHTLHDHGRDDFFPDAAEVVGYLRRKYRLAVVSITWADTMEKRAAQIRSAPFADAFEIVKLILPGADGKDGALEATVRELGLSYGEVALVDDRVVRSIAWGNRRGCVTIWLRKGKFSGELPDQSTGEPTYTIHELSELKNIL